MNSHPERSENASAYARGALRCREVREDVVALQRGDLSPLRAESVRQHLASCPECREEAIELEIAVRSFARLPELVPPRDLAARAWRKILQAGRSAGLLASGSPPAARTADREPKIPAGRAGPPPAEPSQDRAPARAIRNGLPEARDPAAGPLRGSAAQVAEFGGVSSGSSPGSETHETKILPAVGASAHGVLFRPVQSPLIRLAVAAVLLLGVITYSVFELDYAVWRIQSQLLGPRYSKAIQRVTEAVLTKLRL